MIFKPEINSKFFVMPLEIDNLDNNEPEVDVVIDPREELTPPKKGFSFKKTILVFFIVFFALGIGASYRVFSYGGKIFRSNKSSFFGQVKELILSSDKEEIKEKDRINILLMGMRGLGHTKDQGGGTFLSDTNIIFSIQPAKKQASMISLPRDLQVDLGNFGSRKVNAAYALEFNETKDHDKASEYTKEIFAEISGLEMDYYVKVDFVGFEKIIDVLGGVDIEVDNSFTDSQYPDTDFGYQTITFESGWEHMNGDRALKYVRSRHGNNGEGSDFSRAKRQQKVLSAVKNKLLSFSVLLNPNKIDKIISSLGDHVRTDLALSEALEMSKIVADVKGEDIINKVVDHSSGGLLHSGTTSGGSYVLIPNAGTNNFSEIHDLAKNIFNTEPVETQDQITSTPEVEVKGATKSENLEPLVLQIQNGTTVQGLAGKTARKLEEQGWKIAGVGNASSFDFDETMIYDYTDGERQEALEKLQLELNAKTQDGSFYPLENNELVDFVVVLGQP